MAITQRILDRPTQLAFDELAQQLAVSAGAGITEAAESVVSGVEKVGNLFKTTILVDLAGLNSGGTAADVIGDDGTGVAHLGQITAGRNGTIIAGKVTCLEVPVTGDTDIDLYSATEATGVEDTAISALTETQLLNSGVHTLGKVGVLTAFPAADEYLYLAGAVGTAGTYSAGKLLIELYGK